METGSHGLDPKDENGTRDIMTWTRMDTYTSCYTIFMSGTLRYTPQYRTHQRSAIILVFRSDTGSFTCKLSIQLRTSRDSYSL